ncbi:MAG: HlyD family secretion protein, partial [Alphaproteobacteria bacterium]|nr:HlyD family secretion protein [Alphaproteobacteria bacterium]
LFRQEVIEAGRERLAGTVVAATPPRSRLYVGLVLVFAALIALVLIFGQYASRAQVKGVVAYDSGIARVYPAAASEIRSFHVRNGMLVAEGAPLVTLSLAQGKGGLASQMSLLGAQDQELARQQQVAASLGGSSVAALEKQKTSLAASIASLERQRGIAAAQAKLAESGRRRSTRLAAAGAGTQRQVEDSRSALLARAAEVEQIGEKLIDQREALQTLDAQIAEKRLDAQRRDAELGAQRAALGEQRTALARESEITLTAPVAGEVGDISAEIGQRARPDASLVTIVPSGSRLEIWLYAPSRAVGFVRPGQEVRLFFDAFPYQKYGAGIGRVTAVSRVSIEPNALDPSLGIQEPVFKIRVRIERAAPRLPDADALLRPGMTLSANLVLERRSLWEVLFNPFRTLVRG